MAQAVGPIRWGPDRVSFELDRFELEAGGRLEVSGRWFGVRGRRFVRPTLTLTGDGERCRSLADLEHKPWSPDEGEPWTAAFPWEFGGAEVLEAELAVAPDVEITLPPPGGTGGRRRKRAPVAGARPDGSRPASGRPDAAGEPQRRREPSETARLHRQVRELTAELVEGKREIDRLRAELERSQEADVLAASALARRDAVLKERDEIDAERATAAQDREEAIRALEAAGAERDKLRAQRDTAVLARDQALGERDAAALARDEALAQRDAATGVQDEALAQRALTERSQTQLAAELDGALAARDQAEVERDTALAARQQASAQLDRLTATHAQLQLERDDALSARGAALVMRNATITGWRPHRDADWSRRGLAIVVLLAVAVALAIVLHLL
jgi:hypothetical protein